MKRLFDLVVSGVLLLILAPLLLCIALLVKLTMGGPVLFRQLRPGLHGEPFELIKFRTMRDAGPNGVDDAARLTRVGSWLRNWSLDELPELYNVLRGDMSIVGPRPLLMEYLPLYNEEQRRRHDVRPGITGWAQVNGRNAVDWPERFALDTWYVDNWSLLLDLRILLLTVARVIARDGIAQPGQATMQKFTGNHR